MTNKQAHIKTITYILAAIIGITLFILSVNFGFTHFPKFMSWLLVGMLVSLVIGCIYTVVFVYVKAGR